MAVKDEVLAFFSAYIEAFKNHDVDAISALWDSTGLFPSADGNFALEQSVFREHLAALLEFYAEQGVVSPAGEVISIDALFPDVVQARVAYRMLGEDRSEIVKWEHVYILRKSDEWRISLSIADDERAAWSSLGVQTF